MIKKIIIYGAGGFGREVKQLIELVNKENENWVILGFLDDNIGKGNLVNNLVVLGDGSFLNDITEDIYVVFSIANPAIIKMIISKVKNTFVKFPNLIHPSVNFDLNWNLIGDGNIITYGCNFTTNIKIGSFNIFNTKIGIGHDVQIGSYNVFQPNVQISGDVTIGNCNYWGLNSCVINKKKIGDSNLVGAGSVLLRNLGNNESVFGNPAKKFNF